MQKQNLSALLAVRAEIIEYSSGSVTRSFRVSLLAISQKSFQQLVGSFVFGTSLHHLLILNGLFNNLLEAHVRFLFSMCLPGISRINKRSCVRVRATR